ncbi:MAG: hypothetical protein HN337_00360 [Deltaproteobacteria bacterium]|nr:hypothetical protein [Deltaproteobacteria bacterium]
MRYMAVDPTKKAGNVSTYESLLGNGAATLFPTFAEGRPDEVTADMPMDVVDLKPSAGRTLKDLEQPARVAENRPPQHMMGASNFRSLVGKKKG